MTRKLYEEQNIQNIANAIREKNGTTTKYKTSEMAAAIRAIPTGSGGSVETCTLSVDFDGPPGFVFNCYYTNGSEYKTVELPGTLNDVLKNTLLVVYGCPAMYIASDNATRLEHDMGTSVFFISGNASITFQG